MFQQCFEFFSIKQFTDKKVKKAIYSLCYRIFTEAAKMKRHCLRSMWEKINKVTSFHGNFHAKETHAFKDTTENRKSIQVVTIFNDSWVAKHWKLFSKSYRLVRREMCHDSSTLFFWTSLLNPTCISFVPFHHTKRRRITIHCTFYFPWKLTSLNKLFGDTSPLHCFISVFRRTIMVFSISVEGSLSKSPDLSPKRRKQGIERLRRCIQNMTDTYMQGKDF